MKTVNKITKAQLKLAESYKDAGYKVMFHINGINIYIETDKGLELKSTKLKKVKK